MKKSTLYCRLYPCHWHEVESDTPYTVLHFGADINQYMRSGFDRHLRILSNKYDMVSGRFLGSKEQGFSTQYFLNSNVSDEDKSKSKEVLGLDSLISAFTLGSWRFECPPLQKVRAHIRFKWAMGNRRRPLREIMSLLN